MKKEELVKTSLKELVTPNHIEMSFLPTDPVEGDCDCLRGRNANTRNGGSVIDEDLIF